MDLIWIGLRDPKVSIRDGAADALSACLSLSQLRDNSLKRQWYLVSYKGLKILMYRYIEIKFGIKRFLMKFKKDSS